MTTTRRNLPPQGFWTPRGRREEITVPGLLMSSSYDGLTTMLPPSIVAEHAIGEDSALTPVRERPEEGSSPWLRCLPLRLRGGADDPGNDPVKPKAGPRSYKEQYKKRKYEEIESTRTSACSTPVPQASSTLRNHESAIDVETSDSDEGTRRTTPVSTRHNLRDQTGKFIPLPSTDSEAEVSAPSKARKQGRPAPTAAQVWLYAAQKKRKERKKKSSKGTSRTSA